MNEIPNNAELIITHCINALNHHIIPHKLEKLKYKLYANNLNSIKN